MAYTGPFPHANSGSVSAIIVSATSFTGNVGNTGKIAPGDATGVGILVNNDSTIDGAISNSGVIEGSLAGIVVARSDFRRPGQFLCRKGDRQCRCRDYCRDFSRHWGSE